MKQVYVLNICTKSDFQHGFHCDMYKKGCKKSRVTRFWKWKIKNIPSPYYKIQNQKWKIKMPSLPSIWNVQDDKQVIDFMWPLNRFILFFSHMCFSFIADQKHLEFKVINRKSIKFRNSDWKALRILVLWGFRYGIWIYSYVPVTFCIMIFIFYFQMSNRTKLGQWVLSEWARWQLRRW